MRDSDSRMSKRWRIIAGLLLAGLIAGIAVQVARSRDPVFQGRPLSLWLGELDNTNELIRAEAENAVRQTGPAATPQLKSLLRVETQFKETFKLWAGSLPFVHFDFVPPCRRQRQALRACNLLKSDARAALPELTTLLQTALVSTNDWRFAQPLEVLHSLAAIGPDAFPILSQMLTNDDRWVRWTALQPLARAEQISSNALPALLQVLSSGESQVRELTVLTLGHVEVAPEVIVPILERTRNDPDERVRFAGFFTLEKVSQRSGASPADR